MSADAPRLVTVALLLLLAALAGLGVAVGSAEIAPAQALGALLGDPTLPSWMEVVVRDVRLPRVLVGVLAGAGLGIAGCALQGMFRNPLADPGVLGLSSGASLGAVVALYLGLAAHSVWAVPVCAFAGAALTAFLVYRIASHRGELPVATLLLAGIAVGAVMQALTSFVLFLSLAEYEVGRQIVFWTLGGLDARTWDHVALATPAIALASALLLLHASDLDALLLGESHAIAVGVDVAQVRVRLISACALLVAAAVAVSGVIGFVGLVVPHLLRLLAGPRHRSLLLLSMLGGAALVVGADLVARTAIAPKELRLGLITAALGGPFFLVLLTRRRREALFE